MGHNESVLLFTIFIAALAIVLVPTIFFLLTCQNTLKSIAPHNRQMNPGEVWLMLIPIFGTIWLFIMVGKISNSIAMECHDRNINTGTERPTYGTGLGMAVCGVLSIIPYIGILLSIAALVLFIVYWVQVYGYKQQFGTYQHSADILDFSQNNS